MISSLAVSKAARVGRLGLASPSGWQAVGWEGLAPRALSPGLCPCDADPDSCPEVAVGASLHGAWVVGVGRGFGAPTRHQELQAEPRAGAPADPRPAYLQGRTRLYRTRGVPRASIRLGPTAWFRAGREGGGGRGCPGKSWWEHLEDFPTFFT